jgi:hypothetical protein
MLSRAGTMESSMRKAGLDNRHRNHDGEISHKHGNTLIGQLRKIYGQSFAAGYPATEKLSEVLLQLNETSLSQLRRDHVKCCGHSAVVCLPEADRYDARIYRSFLLGFSDRI